MSNSKVSLSNLDRSISIFTAINTYHSRKLNEQILIQQCRSNSQLSELSRQMDMANATNRKILQNQIQEIQNKEKQKFYKALSFNTNEIIEQLEKVSDLMVLNYLMDTYYEKTKITLLNAINTLEEINDKLFDKQILDKLNALKNKSDLNSENYSHNVLSKIDGLLLDLKEKEKNINELKTTKTDGKKVKSQSNILRIFGILIFGFLILIFLVGLFIPQRSESLSPNQIPDVVGSLISLLLFGVPFFLLIRKEIKWRKQVKEDQVLQNQKKVEMGKQRSEEIERHQETLLHHSAVIAMNEISTNHPTLERTLTEIAEKQTLFENKFESSDVKNIDRNRITNSSGNLDSMFEQCARLLVASGSGSTSMLQRRFNLGYNRAGRIMEQLEAAGIVGSNIGSKPRELLIRTENDLNRLLISIMK